MISPRDLRCFCRLIRGQYRPLVFLRALFSLRDLRNELFRVGRRIGNSLFPICIRLGPRAIVQQLAARLLLYASKTCPTSACRDSFAATIIASLPGTAPVDPFSFGRQLSRPNGRQPAFEGYARPTVSFLPRSRNAWKGRSTALGEKGASVESAVLVTEIVSLYSIKQQSRFRSGGSAVAHPRGYCTVVPSKVLWGWIDCESFTLGRKIDTVERYNDQWGTEGVLSTPFSFRVPGDQS
ncbi:hypothetical protein Mal15_42030 [Stieleria maiorica]|uniref:Uncharacterized protein n=1 Tax=Stieleria maiorica TaxID=2795974 RepID=A0A5B9MGW6_9BACT|nr:hypothetical protein Mal15_42030 [Stieleria maiorica]